MASPPSLTNGTLDVYAKPFVPEFLRAINRAHAPHRYPLRKRSFDVSFDKYIRSFSGTDFAQPLPPENTSQIGQALLTSNSMHNLEVKNYRHFFSIWMRTEFSAVQAVQDQYDLFKIPILFSQTSSPTEITLTATFEVPGLGENSPYVRVGDVIHVRPLALDHTGSPLHYVQGYENGAFISSQLYLPGWTGDLYHAEVTGLKRNTETIDVKMTFTIELYALLHTRVTASIYNVQFPPREDVEASFWRAVRTASGLLGSASNTYAAALANDNHKPNRQGWLPKMLFPDPSHGQQQTKLNSVRFRFQQADKQLNHEQLRAVDFVITQNYGTVPFIVHGPPGTGKTKTMVEIVLQLLSEGVAKHILVCAPSDPAADTLGERLKNSLQRTDMLRLNSPSSTFAEVPGGLLPYCYIDGDRFSIPPFKDMMRYKVVVTTCRDADILTKARLTNRALHEFEVNLLSALHEDGTHVPSLHWQALLIDEAAQATEPEALIPLNVVAPPSGENAGLKAPIFVMAGDQQQLGPGTASRKLTIRTSLFERLLGRPLYADHPLARHRLRSGVLAARSLTKSMLPIIRPPFSNLLRNYRSHPSILAVPNALFYHDTLIPEATDTKSLLDWEGWMGKWPVLFAHHLGQDEIETDGGGWYNSGEVEKAYSYAISLLRSRLVAQEDICIMSPFSAQVRRLRRNFRAMGLHDVNIGPMEAFQGLESKAVILCTTRSRTRFLDQDQARDFGIINEPKRFNVAITRAKNGLIVIGNREVLSVDPCWRAFLDFCIRNDLFDGEVDEQAANIARGAPSTTLEWMLKQSDARPGPTTLGLTGELEDPMWIQGAENPLDDEEDEADDGDDLEYDEAGNDEEDNLDDDENDDGGDQRKEMLRN